MHEKFKIQLEKPTEKKINFKVQKWMFLLLVRKLKKITF